MEKRTENETERIGRLLKEADEIDYGSILKMMRGEPLSGHDRENIEKYNRQYDEAREIKRP